MGRTFFEELILGEFSRDARVRFWPTSSPSSISNLEFVIVGIFPMKNLC